VTLDVSHEAMFPLNVESKNMLVMFVTLDVSHEAMVPLNAIPSNRKLIFVTRVVTMLLKGTKFPAFVK